jgi:hypothetical protein
VGARAGGIEEPRAGAPESRDAVVDLRPDRDARLGAVYRLFQRSLLGDRMRMRQNRRADTSATWLTS